MLKLWPDTAIKADAYCEEFKRAKALEHVEREISDLDSGSGCIGFGIIARDHKYHVLAARRLTQSVSVDPINCGRCVANFTSSPI
jgi:hypothetical protein